ncbi:dTMP kinase [Devosia sp. 2618]|uniref:dTMP kinase n=1 Tax=Devosia sp. 2618 TaxID=3156454 RepID=UPI003393FA70
MPEASNSSRARFITFEGGEGVGKSTQIKRLQQNLERRAINVVRTREPGGTPKAEAIRSFILQGRSESWGPGAEAVLFAAARLDHVNQLIAPNLRNGTWVLSDRFHDSTRAYQGLTGGVDDKLIAGLESLALDGNTPDLTIVLDMDPDAAFKRVADRAIEDGLALTGDRFEKEEIEWHKRLREGFLAIAKENPDRCVVIEAAQSENALEAAIWAVVSQRFPELLEGSPA